jgi:hypothetical protein
MSYCPSCPTAEMVRSVVLDDGFWVHVLAVALPLVVLAIVAAVAYGYGVRSAEA